MVSIVIPTCNRQEYLMRLLDSFRELVFSGPIEIIIIDNGDDGTDAAIAALKERYPYEIKYIHVSGVLSPGMLRNRGVAEACGSILVFTDSDCLVTPAWLSSLCEPFAEEAVGGVGGPDTAYPHDTAHALCENYVLTASLTTGGIRGAEHSHFRYQPRSFNMAVRRTVFDAVGGFPDLFYAEDILFSARIEKAGNSLVFSKNAVVHHARKKTIRAFVRHLFSMGKARPTVAGEMPELLQWQHTIPAWHTGYVFAAAVLTMLSGVAWLLWLVYAVGVGIFSAYVRRDVSEDEVLKERVMYIVFLFLLQQYAYGCGFTVGLVSFFQKKGNVT